MNEGSLRICIWSGLVSAILFAIGMWPLAHFIPLLDPLYTADEIVAIYQANTIGIRLGAMVLMFSGTVNAAFFGAMYIFIKRIEGPNGPYAMTQAISAAVLIVCIFLPAMLIGVTAFRPERAPELTLLMNDLSWIALVIPTPPGIMQGLAIGFAILGDKSPQPLLPRWTGYLSLWLAVLTIPAPLALMFKSGPFAWNGLLAFWLPAGIAGIWVIAMIVNMLKSVHRVAAGADA